MIEKLTADKLRRVCDIGGLAEAREVGLVGQPRAEKSLKFGLSMKKGGYNVYASGAPRSGKTSFSEKFAREFAEKEPAPPDLCYVYNFDEPKRPKLLKLPAGGGKVFADEMEEVITVIQNELTTTFSSKDFEDSKNAIVKVFQDERDEIVKDIQDGAKERNFDVKLSGGGIYFIPVVDGAVISEEQYDALTETERVEIVRTSDDIQEQALVAMRKVRDAEKVTRQKVEALEYNTVLFCVGRHMARLFDKYSDDAGVFEYLAWVKEDLLENSQDFASGEGDEGEDMMAAMPWLMKRPPEDAASKYKVNLITDNGGLTHAPVVVDFKPTYSSLAGEVEFDSEYGNFITDFMKIKPGLLHKANGGYLILQAYDVLTAPHVWETLRQVIKTGEVVIEPLREGMTGLAVSGIRPEPAKVDVKVILVGSRYYYDLLSDFDDDFPKFFKVNAVFDYEMSYDKNAADLAGYIADYAKKESLPPFDSGAVKTLIEYSTRLAENKNKITAQLGRLSDIMLEAASLCGGEGVTGDDVKAAVSERDYRNNIYEEKLGEMIDEGLMMIDTDGSKNAQINGLAVIDAGDYVFAKPSRITATTYVGKSGIVNIEKESEMSGSIHDKGVEILTGYLGQMYAQEFPLSLSCRICFEQNYNGIDGDSASSTELYAILSSLADVPIKQSLAVTGSINQRGEIQPIGGVTYKIEGFFDLCEKRGLTGEQGVIIPRTNVSDLTLNDKVVSAVERGEFHIYAITGVDDGIALLTGFEAGAKNDKGKFPADSIHGKVYKKLKDFYKKSAMEE